ncbi:hypothetical protein NG799_01520 [Laspinema sp. D1]|uniref:Uncharacterized protein n=2 Tax=Laspinema TaxID=2584823 RepID=A0ABT2MLY4_9CYAN|nr:MULTISPECIES: hypothetical protein [unclassified Laspinema]MCT7965010.1 hypothetical protein [Laspinema sp. D2a]MCT7977705.1 hypothetical protein [Laspinema sp. D3b]MCT7992551.1 hypothetical protein [Laspinema sp. D3c]
MSRRKGKKSMKDEGSIWDEPKTARLNASLTPTGYKGLKALGKRLSLSISEIIERLGRQELQLPTVPQKKIEYGEILRSLPQFSPKVLVLIASKALNLAKNRLDYDSPTLPDLLSGLDLSELSDNSLIPLDDLQQLIQGDRPPTQGEIIQLASALDMNYEDLAKLLNGYQQVKDYEQLPK